MARKCTKHMIPREIGSFEQLTMAGFRTYSEIIGNGQILKFFLANLFSTKKEAYTNILRLVGVCIGEFFTKNTMKL